MDLFNNLSINLKAAGPAAVIIVWILAVTTLGLWGDGEIAEGAFQLLAIAGGMILVTLAAKA
ncbi:hypothetical protein [Magnetofaba australis]|uniref:hypothetical protein n=1 Tax=Magnetofaba australis TaxID=1472297 RepID=UPI000A19C611|nr:hypothetical protein [Magnetofaba australis]